MNDDDKDLVPLRTVDICQVAQYLGCNPDRLAIVLRRLSENPAAIMFAPGEGACICPAVMNYKLAPQTEVEILEALMRMPDGRAAQ
jgi:hypothetical protein